MPNLSIALFGAGRILGPDGKELDLRGRKEFALLAFLATESESAHRRDFLGGLLWPEMGDSEFRNNLRVALSRLKNSLSRSGIEPLLIDRQTVQLKPSPDIEIDTYRFWQLVRDVDSHKHEEITRCQKCLPRIKEAIALYKGEFLRGFHVDDSYAFDDWLTIQREHFHLRMLELLEIMDAAYLHEGDLHSAMTTVRQRLTLDPLQERAHRQLMLLMVQNGERHSALVQYENCRRLLDEELGVPPAPETAALYQQIRDGLFLEVSDAESLGELPYAIAKHEGVSVTEAVQSQESEAPEGLMEPRSVSPTDQLLASANPTNLRSAFDAQLSRWATVSNQKLFGIEGLITELFSILESKDRPWLVSIDGIGGIGKTSIAKELVHQLIDTARFERVAWVSAKQEEFGAEFGVQPTQRPALDADEMVTELLAQLTDAAIVSGSAAERQQALVREMQEEPALVVVDNLETVADYQALVPLLVSLSNPSKFIITSRLSLRGYPDVYTQTIGELTVVDTFALLRYEARVRGITLLIDASDEHLQAIYDVVGGHPLALNLVLGQLTYLPMGQVLTGLQEARGERIEQLYSYIYWQAWQMLDDAGRQLLLTLPVVFNGTFEQLGAASLLEPDELQQALTRLIGLSLVQVAGEIMEPRYRLHRLTETFLMNEVLKWQSR